MFCIQHYDLKVLSPKGGSYGAAGMGVHAHRPVPEKPIHRAMGMMESSDVIFNCCTEWHCHGGGSNWPLACDLRLVQGAHHQFGLPENKL